MEKRNIFLKGIAGVLNAGGSALVEIYDTVTGFKVTSQPGERGKLKGQVREYEKKIEKLHYEIGREVALQGTGGRTSAAAEAAIRLATEYREKADEIKSRIREIEEKERAETLAAAGRSPVKRESPVIPEVSIDDEVKLKETPDKDTAAEIAIREYAAEDVREESAEKGMENDQRQQDSMESLADTKSGEEVIEPSEEMLKSELLKICDERGIDANDRMTKAAILELIKRGEV